MQNVLVCDDDEAILESLRIYLDNAGFNVITAVDGQDALEKVQNNEIHCVVLDIMMPRLDGLKATLKIREKYNFPIILLSAKSEDTDKITGLGFSLSWRKSDLVWTGFPNGPFGNSRNVFRSFCVFLLAFRCGKKQRSKSRRSTERQRILRTSHICRVGDR